MILAAYLSCWRALRPGVQRWVVALLLLLMGGSLLWQALPAGKPDARRSDAETPYSRLSTTAVIRGGR